MPRKRKQIRAELFDIAIEIINRLNGIGMKNYPIFPFPV